MTRETKSIIDSGFEKLLNQIEESIVIGASEEVGPNNNEYELLLDKYWEESMYRLKCKLAYYADMRD